MATMTHKKMDLGPKIALYEPDIPQNTAAIISLSACFNTTLEIIEPCGFHLDDKRLKKVAMDYFDKSFYVLLLEHLRFLCQKELYHLV